MAKKKAPPGTYSPVLQRIAAYLIDLFLVFLVMELLLLLLGIKRAELGTADQLKFDITSNVFFSLYTFLFTAFFMKGQTVGKRLMGLRVVSLSTGDGSLIAGEILFREMVGKLFVEKANIWISFLLVSTGAQETLFAWINNGFINTTLYYVIMIPWPLLVSLSMVVNRDDHRSLHDLMAGTQVVPAEKRKSVFRYD